jgi:MFS family permease
MRSRLRRVLEPVLPVGRFTQMDRRIVLVIWVAGVIQGFAQSQASATLPFTRIGLGLSEGDMSLLLGLARISAFAALPLGWLGDHKGRRRPFLVAVTLIVLGGALAGLAVDAWQFGLFQAVLRTGTAACSALAVVILAETVTPRIRAYAISFFGAAVSFGSGMALMTLPLADGGADAWRIPYLLTAAGLLLLPFLIRRVPESHVYQHDPGGGHWRDLLGGQWSTRFWTVVVINFLSSAYGAVGAAFSTERLINYVGVSTGKTTVILLIGGTMGGIGFFIGGRLADTWGRRTTSVVALVLTIVGGITLYSVTSIPVVVIAAMVSAFGTFAFVPAGGSHRAELFPTRLRSSANTAATNAATAGSATGLIAGVWTIDTFGLSQTVYLLAIGVAVSAALTLTLPETRGQDLTAVAAAGR